jgi:DNA invertase Pin-like site-specific DNA recombinase
LFTVTNQPYNLFYTSAAKIFHDVITYFEKDIIRERVVAGLENAKQKGKQLGRLQIYLLNLLKIIIKIYIFIKKSN